MRAYEIYQEYEEDKYQTSTQKKVKNVLAEAKQEGILPHPETTNLQEAKEILQENFLGPEALKTTFNIECHNIPNIPFSTAELHRAKELNQYLILRVSQTEQGQPLTMQTMQTILKTDKTLYNTDWYKNEPFFTQETPQLSWALVSKEPIPNSTNKNYLKQTETIIDYITNQVFKDQPLPPEYQEAIAQFNNEKSTIEPIISSNWQEAAKQLENLKITQLTRQTPVEILYDLLMNLKANNQRLLESKYTWSARRSSDGYLVSVGSFVAFGAGVFRFGPVSSYGGLVVSFSRSGVVN